MHNINETSFFFRSFNLCSMFLYFVKFMETHKKSGLRLRSQN